MSVPDVRPARTAPALRARVALAATCGALWLAGCAAPRPPAAPSADGRVHDWSGRFSATWRAAGDLPEQTATGRFTLAEQGSRVGFELLSPFGQTLARADSGPAGAHLETADGRSFSAPDAESLTELALGWRVPVGRLPAWLRGELPGADPAAPGEVRDALDSDWSVRVEGGREGHPARVSLAWPGGRASPPAVRIRLVLDQDEPRP